MAKKKKRRQYLFMPVREVPRPLDEPSPKSGWARVGYVLREFPLKLLWANFLAFIFGGAMITLPAALTALMAVIEQFYRDGYGDVWPVFWKEFKTALLRRLGYFLILLAVPCAFFALGLLFSDSGWSIGFGSFGTVFSICIAAWWFPQMAIMDMTPGQAFKNAVLLLFIEVEKNVILVAMTAIVGALVAWFWSYSVFALAFGLPALLMLCHLPLVNPVIEERLWKEPAAESTEETENESVSGPEDGVSDGNAELCAAEPQAEDKEDHTEITAAEPQKEDV